MVILASKLSTVWFVSRSAHHNGTRRERGESMSEEKGVSASETP